jgi:AcrR family transcriptional regulator
MARVSADVRRQELVEAAIRVMARDGVAKATTRAIVAEADMHLGFFHYCFRSKEELLLQVIDTINERNVRAVLDVLSPRKGLAETLRTSVRAYWELVEKNPGEHQVTYELTQFALRRPGLEDVARKQYDGYVTAATRFLEAVAEELKVEWTVPLPVLARMTQVVLDGATLAWVVDRDSDQTVAVLDQMVEYLAGVARKRRTKSS